MSEWRKGWLVARREVRERGRSRAFWVSIVVTVVAVAAMILLPAAVTTGSNTRHVGLTGVVPDQLPGTIRAQAQTVGMTVRIDRYDSLAAGEQAVRDRHVDVLVVDARRLEWPRAVDGKLEAVVTGAVQLEALRGRAEAAGISPSRLSALLAPVPIQNTELGSAPGRGPDDETVALVTAGLLLFCIATFGSLVLSGVVEEKASRVVEVLLTRVSARTLLAGKVTGIGLLGLAQIAVVAAVALVAARTVSSVDLPSVRASVAVWVVVWFVLGYALYATAFGALGSLAARVEDAQTVAGPVTVLLVAAYFLSFAAIGSPTARWSTVTSIVPLTAPMAMPGRVAMGVTAWWEPALAVALTLVTIAALVHFGGRLYVRAILHGGTTLSLRQAWHSTAAPSLRPVRPAEPQAANRVERVRAVPARWTSLNRSGPGTHPLRLTIVICLGVALGVVVAVLAHDVIMGVIVGALLVTLVTRIGRLWTGHGRVRHP